MAGFDGALDAPRSARFGEGSGDIVLDVVGCEGTEVNIAECAHRGIGVHYCGHDEDAGATCYTGAHPHPFEIRLVDGSNKSEGRVEVLYEGSWATVCDNGWDLRDAKVVCRMLGFDGALEATTSARFGQGAGKILLDLVGCDGTERNLADCAHLGIGVHYCGHEEDVGAVCYSGVHPNSFGIRLVGGSNNSEGRVEIEHNGTWGTVCDDGWDLRDARVVCRMLGYSEAQSAPGSARFGKGSGEILLTLVGCDGTEDNLADCAHLGFGVHNCNHDEDAGVTCLLGVRLVGGADEYEGRVEILHEGRWGTVCDDLWDLNDASVVCKQLGFDGASAAPHQAHFGQGSGEILLDGVQCNGTEANIKECRHKGIAITDCGHKEDASAICMRPGDTEKTPAFKPIVLDVTTIRLSTNNPTTAGFTSVSSSSTENTSLHQMTFIKTENPNSTTKPALLLDLWIIVLIGIGGLLFSVILILTCCCGFLKVRRRMAEKNVDSDIYMDVTNMEAVQALSMVSAYQDLNAPPLLPERRKPSVLSHHYESNIGNDGDDKHGINDRSEYMTKDKLHEYMDMKNIYQIPETEKDIEGYILPKSGVLSDDGTSVTPYPVRDIKSETNIKHDYTYMKTVYQKPLKGKDIDLDGYLLPGDVKSGNESTENYGETKTAVQNDRNVAKTAPSTPSIKERIEVPINQNITLRDTYEYMDHGKCE